jgi:hypothetical protein
VEEIRALPPGICPHPADTAKAKKNKFLIILLSYPYNAEYS